MSSFCRSLSVGILAVLALVVPARAQVVGPAYTFVVNTIISPDEVNTNFSTIYANALNRFGGQMGGHLTFTPGNTFDILHPRDLTLDRNATIGGTLGVTGATTLSSLTATGIATFNTNVGVGGTFSVTGASTFSAAVGVTGTVTATTFAGSGASLTSIPETAIVDGAILARVGAAETISGAYTFATAPTLQSGLPSLVWHNTAALADAKRWQAVAGSSWALQTLTDAGAAGATIVEVSRSGTTPTAFTVNTAMYEPISQNQTFAVGTNTVTLAATTQVVRVTTVSGGANVLDTLNGGANGRRVAICHVASGGGTLDIYGTSFGYTIGSVPTQSCVNYRYDGSLSRWLPVQ